MADRTCGRCGKGFRDPSKLTRHRNNKKPCDLIVEAPAEGHACKYCGRSYTTKTSLYRHMRQTCKVANTEEGMEKLLDHTLARQLAELKLTQAAQTAELQAQTAELQAQVAELAALLKGQLALAAPAAQQIAQVNHGAAQVNTGPVTNNIINIHPWDGDRRVGVDLSHIIAAFSDNAKLKEYAQMGDHELTDPDIAPPYVTELLMDLTKRAHEDPATRNIYINPRRADQVLVHKKSGHWDVLPLEEATRLLFDGAAKTIHRAVITYEERHQLPQEAQHALSVAGMLYDEEPEEYARRAKKPMAAHLANTAPAPALAAP